MVESLEILASNELGTNFKLSAMRLPKKESDDPSDIFLRVGRDPPVHRQPYRLDSNSSMESPVP